MVDKRYLAVFMGDGFTPGPAGEGAPKLADMAYARPNPDGSRKSCLNCVFWARGGACGLFPPGTYIPGDAFCSRHVFGTPGDEALFLPGVAHLSPDAAKLVQVPGGASCDRCDCYEPGDGKTGVCQAAADDTGARALVEPLAVCARWERR